MCPVYCFDSSGLLQTQWQSQNLNRNYFTDVFQLTRDKLVLKITSTPFLPHIPTKGRNIQAFCLFFLMYYTNRTFLRNRTKNMTAQVYLNISWDKFQGPELKDRQVANDIWRKIFIVIICLCLLNNKYSFTRSSAFVYCNTLSCNCDLQGNLALYLLSYHAITFGFLGFCLFASDIYFTDLLETEWLCLLW